MIGKFFKEGETVLAWAHVAMVTFNVANQLTLVYFQKRKKRLTAMALEMGLTILCLKPALDAKRVISGRGQVRGGDRTKPTGRARQRRPHPL